MNCNWLARSRLWFSMGPKNARVLHGHALNQCGYFRVVDLSSMMMTSCIPQTLWLDTCSINQSLIQIPVEKNMSPEVVIREASDLKTQAYS